MGFGALLNHHSNITMGQQLAGVKILGKCPNELDITPLCDARQFYGRHTAVNVELKMNLAWSHSHHTAVNVELK